jgi:hypothetical protein
VIWGRVYHHIGKREINLRYIELLKLLRCNLNIMKLSP